MTSLLCSFSTPSLFLISLSCPSSFSAAGPHTRRETAACFTLGGYEYVFFIENRVIEDYNQSDVQLLAVPVPEAKAAVEAGIKAVTTTDSDATPAEDAGAAAAPSADTPSAAAGSSDLDAAHASSTDCSTTTTTTTTTTPSSSSSSSSDMTDLDPPPPPPSPYSKAKAMAKAKANAKRAGTKRVGTKPGAEISILDICGGTEFVESREVPAVLSQIEKLMASHGLKKTTAVDFVAALLRVSLGVTDNGSCPLSELTTFARKECRGSLIYRSGGSVGVGAMKNIGMEMPCLDFASFMGRGLSDDEEDDQEPPALVPAPV